MRMDDGAPQPRQGSSVWFADGGESDYPALRGDVTVDVAVLGGGITGVTAAVLLKEAGRAVALIEARRIGAGVTGHTTAKLTSLHKLIYADLVRRHGETNARLYGEANQAAIEWVAENVRRRGIACDFARADAFTYAEEAGDITAVEEEARVAASLGLPALATTATGLPFPVAAAVRFRDQARFHPRKYLLAMARAVAGEGSLVFERTTATAIRDGTTCEVRTDGGLVRARSVIVATHQPLGIRGLHFARMTLKRSFALGLLVRGPVPQGMYISTALNFRSMRPQPHSGRDLLILGGEPFRTGQCPDTRELLHRLEAWGRERFDVERVAFRWATQDAVSPDRLPFVGRLTPSSKNVWFASGFGGWGMTNGTAAALLLTDLILGRRNPWAAVYDPRRGAPALTLKGLARDAITTIRSIAGDGGAAPRDLAPGEGCVADAALSDAPIEKVALRRDESGRLHALSAVCPHLQGIVRWNAAERSWDCPCHGSRFDADGTLLHGPALAGLAPLDPRAAPPARSAGDRTEDRQRDDGPRGTELDPHETPA